MGEATWGSTSAQQITFSIHPCFLQEVFGFLFFQRLSWLHQRQQKSLSRSPSPPIRSFPSRCWVYQKALLSQLFLNMQLKSSRLTLLQAQLSLTMASGSTLSRPLATCS